MSVLSKIILEGALHGIKAAKYIADKLSFSKYKNGGGERKKLFRQDAMALSSKNA